MKLTRFAKKVTSIITIPLCLLLQLPLQNAWALPVPQAAVIPQASPIGALEIPKEFGSLEAIHISDQGAPALVHIQSAHGSYEAQKNIQALLSTLTSKYNFKTLFLEGASSDLHPEFFRFFPEDRELNLKIADSLARKAELTGPELFLIASDQKNPKSQIRAHGIEDAGAYRENRQAFQQVLLARDKTQNFLNDMNSQIDRMTAPYLNSALKNYLRRLEAHETQNGDMIAWIHFLKEQARNHLEIDFEDAFYQKDWPMLVRFTRLEKIEKNMDHSALEHEKQAFLEKLKALKMDSELIQKTDGLLVFLNGKSEVREQSHAEILDTLGDLAVALPQDFSFASFQNIKFYMQYLLLKNELNNLSVIEELEKLESSLGETMAKTETEKKLWVLFKDYRLLTKLFALELTQKDYEKIGQNQAGDAPSQIVKKFEKINQANRVKNIRFSHLEEIDRLYTLALAFYAGAKQRDGRMAHNLLKQMQASHENRAIVVTGGFHSEGMKQYFENKGFSYYLLSPRITEAGDNRAYHRAMLEINDSVKKSHIENIMKLQTFPDMIKQGANPKHIQNVIAKALIENKAPLANLAINALNHFGLKISQPRSEARSNAKKTQLGVEWLEERIVQTSVPSLPSLTDQSLVGDALPAVTSTPIQIDYGSALTSSIASIATSSATTADITPLPGTPIVDAFGWNGATASASPTSRGMNLTFNTGTNTAAGIAASFRNDNYGTPGIETADLSNLSQLVFGFQGNASQVKIEIVTMVNGQEVKAWGTISGITSAQEQALGLPLSSFNNIANADLHNVRMINFIIEGANQSGTLTINRVAALSPSATLTPNDVTYVGNQGVWTLGNTPVTVTPRGFSVFTTTTETQASIGAGFPISADLSGTNLRFGIKSNGPVTVELVTTGLNGQKISSYVYLTNLQPNIEQVVEIPTAMFAGANLKNSMVIYFHAGSEAGQSVFLEVNRIAPASYSGFTQNPSYLTSAITTSGSTTTVTITNKNNGAKFQYKYSTTIAPQIILTDKFLVVDLANDTIDVIRNDWSNKNNLGIKTTLTGLRNADDVSMFPSYISNYIQIISYSAQYPLPHPTRTFSVVSTYGTLAKYVQELNPYDINIPGNPNVGLVAPAGNQTAVVATPYGMDINFALQNDWAGGNFYYSTPQDWSKLASVVVGIKGGQDQTVRIELKDVNGNTWSNQASQLSPTVLNIYSYATMPMKLYSKIDLTKIVALTIIVEGGTRSGDIQVYRTPPSTTTTTSAASATVSTASTIAWTQDLSAESLGLMNDPFSLTSGSWGQPYQDLWWLNAVGAPEAWNVTRGAGTVVAVIDTGVDLSHPDIDANLLTNPIVIGRDLDLVDADTIPLDANGHGTYIAGIIAAEAGNAQGIAGIAPESKILPIRVLGQNGTGFVSNVAQGIRLAADLGADVINLSMNIPASALPQSDKMLLEEAVNYAMSKGIMIVTAAGNSGGPVDNFLAGIKGVGTVGALEPVTLNLADFSNVGRQIDLVAPGVDILSLKADGTPFGSTSVVSPEYVRASGTSPAAAIVSGVSALLKSINKDFSPRQILSFLTRSAIDLGKNGFDSLYGWGLVNAAGAVGLGAEAVKHMAASTEPPVASSLPPVLNTQAALTLELTASLATTEQITASSTSVLSADGNFTINGSANAYTISSADGSISLTSANEVSSVQQTINISQIVSNYLHTGPFSWNPDGSGKTFVNLQSGQQVILSDQLAIRSGGSREPLEDLPNFIEINGQFIPLTVTNIGSNPIGWPQYQVSFTVPQLKGDGTDKIEFLSPYDSTHVLTLEYAINPNASVWAKFNGSAAYSPDQPKSNVLFTSTLGSQIVPTGLADNANVTDWHFDSTGTKLVITTDTQTVTIDVPTNLSAPEQSQPPVSNSDLSYTKTTTGKGKNQQDLLTIKNAATGVSISYTYPKGSIQNIQLTKTFAVVDLNNGKINLIINDFTNSANKGIQVSLTGESIAKLGVFTNGNIEVTATTSTPGTNTVYVVSPSGQILSTKSITATTLATTTATATATQEVAQPLASTATTTSVSAPSNAAFTFTTETDSSGVTQVYLNTPTGIKTLVTTAQAGETAAAMDVNPEGTYALVNIQKRITNADGTYKDTGELRLFNITSQSLVEAERINLAFNLNTATWENQNLGTGPTEARITGSYEFSQGYVLFNSTLKSFNGHTLISSPQGLILNLNLAIPRVTETSLTSVFTNYQPVLTPQGDKLLVGGAYHGAGTNAIGIYDVASGNFVYQSLSNYGFGGIKAVRLDGAKLIAAGSLNAVYVVSISDLTQPAQVVNLTAGTTLVSAKFNQTNPAVAELTSSDGKKYTLDTNTLTLTPISTPTTGGKGKKNSPTTTSLATVSTASLAEPLATSQVQIAATGDTIPSADGKFTINGSANAYTISSADGSISFTSANEVSSVQQTINISQIVSNYLHTGPFSWNPDGSGKTFVNLQSGQQVILSDQLAIRSGGSREPLEDLPNFIEINGQFIPLTVTNTGSNPIGWPQYQISFTVPQLKGDGTDKIEFLSPYDSTHVLTLEYAINSNASVWAKFNGSAAYSPDQPKSNILFTSTLGSQIVSTGLADNANVTDWHFDSTGTKLVITTDTQTVTINVPANLLTATPPADITAPVLSAIQSSNVTSNGAAISWTTDENATSQVKFGTSPSLGSASNLDSTPVQNHSVSLSNLQPGTVYYYQIESRDAAGNISLSPVSTFTTETAAPPVSSPAVGTDQITPIPGIYTTRNFSWGGATGAILPTSRGTVATVNVGPTGGAVVALTYDKFETSQIETADWSGISQRVIGLKGDVSQVLVEVVAMVKGTEVKGTQLITGIEKDIEKGFVIDISKMLNISGNLATIRMFNIVVTGPAAGKLEINTQPATAPSTTLTTANLTRLPFITIWEVGPTKQVVSTQITSTGFSFSYNTGLTGYAGAGPSFDKFSTKKTIEVVDLSQPLILAIKGSTPELKVEFVAIVNGQEVKHPVYLTNIRPDAAQIYEISGFAATRVVYFIVEGANKTGTMEVNWVPTASTTTATTATLMTAPPLVTQPEAIATSAALLVQPMGAGAAEPVASTEPVASPSTLVSTSVTPLAKSTAAATVISPAKKISSLEEAMVEFDEMLAEFDEMLQEAEKALGPGGSSKLRSEVRKQLAIAGRIMDGLLPLTSPSSALGIAAARIAYAMLYHERLNPVTAENGFVRNQRRIDMALSRIGVKANVPYAYILGSGFAIEDDALGFVREVFGSTTPMAVIVKTPQEKRIVEEFNKKLKPAERFLIANNAAAAATALRKQIEDLVSRAGGMRPFTLQAIINEKESDLARALKAAGIRNPIILQQSQFQAMVEMSGVQMLISKFEQFKAEAMKFAESA